MFASVVITFTPRVSVKASGTSPNRVCLGVDFSRFVPGRAESIARKLTPIIIGPG
jgi:hypothetical protein